MLKPRPVLYVKGTGPGVVVCLANVGHVPMFVTGMHFTAFQTRMRRESAFSTILGGVTDDCAEVVRGVLRPEPFASPGDVTGRVVATYKHTSCAYAPLVESELLGPPGGEGRDAACALTYTLSREWPLNLLQLSDVARVVKCNSMG